MLGGLLVALAGWRGIFWFNLGFGLAALAAAAWTLPESSDPQGRKLDVPGLVTGVIAVSALTFAVIEGENAGFSTWWIELLFALAAVAAVLFVMIERRTGDPVVRLEYFRIPAYSSANAVAFATSFGLFAVFFFTALYLQVQAKFSGGEIALEFLAMAVAMVVAGQVAGAWTAARGPRCADGARLPARRAAGCSPSTRCSRPTSRSRPARGRARGGRLRPRAGARRGDRVGARDRAGRALGDGGVDREHEPRARRRARGRDPRRGHQRPARRRARRRKLGGLGVPPDLQQLVVHAVTHGGLPANAALAILANPVVAAEALPPGHPREDPRRRDDRVRATRSTWGSWSRRVILLAGAGGLAASRSRGFPSRDSVNADAIRRTASSSSARGGADVQPREARGPARRRSGPGLSATLPRSRNASAGSSPSPSSRQSSQARYPACGGM